MFDALGTPHVIADDPRYSSITTRAENIDSIYSELAETLQTRTSADWLELFDKADIPAMPLNTPESLLTDPHLDAVGFFKTVEHPTEGTIHDMTVPAKWSLTQPTPEKLAPRLGEHSLEILREIDFDETRIADMMANGVSAVADNRR